MKENKLAFLIFLSLVTFFAYGAGNPAIIPQPYSIHGSTGEYVFDMNSKVSLAGCKEDDIKLFITQFRKASGFPLQVSHKKGNGLVFRIDPKLDIAHDDGYTLTVNQTGVEIKAKTVTGLFYGGQTLRQLLPTTFESDQTVAGQTWKVGYVSITDYLRFEWQGYMKDVSRTFYSVDVIKKYLDIMAMYKLNTFHLHLTDDQGWRIEIRKYPELTSERATVFSPLHHQPKERSGYFSQDDIRDIVAYAADRHIKIVPEIDVPGHCWPIILVKPELGTNQVTSPPYVFPFNDSWGYWGFQFTPNPLDPTKEAVYQFLDDVFTEVAALFPGEYIHFGGDEVVHRLWEKEPHVKSFMKERGMEKVEQLQSYFVKRVSEIIVSKGKKPIGWNDILADADNLPGSTAIMSWLGADAVKKAAGYHFYTVATPTGPMYFDITQDSRDDGTMSDLNYGNINSLDKVYAYDPHGGLSEEQKKYVLGIQANMWPAVPQEIKDVNVQNFPRIIALSETAWSDPAVKNFASFVNRLNDNHYARLDLLKVDYFRKGGYIVGGWQPDQIDTVFRAQEWDVSRKVYTNGRVMAGFFYIKGSSYLSVRNVQLLQDGKVISTDGHRSLADNFRGVPFKKDMFFYHLLVENFDPKAVYALRAEIAGATGTDSQGNVIFNLSPFKPFSVTEAFKTSL